ncbi:MAG: glycosyltransferase family 4 protein [Verrucomicrobia bacterium]|nr:glycosyltransferase family 4 protein [Verrucomicrobiota bacterium]
MIRILVYSQTFFPVMGGLERNTFTLCRLLTEWGHPVTLVTETMEEDTRNFSFRVIRTRSQAQIVREVLRAELVLMNGGISVKVCFPALLSGKRYAPIYQSSDLFVRENDLGLGAWVRSFLAARATLHVTVSRFAKARLETLLPGKKCLAVPNPIDAELLHLVESSAPAEKEFDLLFAGRLIDGKGIFHLLEALEMLRDRMMLRVAFAGEGEHQDQLVQQAAKRRVPIELLGRLDRDSLIQAYRKARVLVVPSSTHTEGNPLVIAEALTCGLPVIASDQGAMVEALGDAGCCFRRYDAADLARQIEWMLSSEHLAETTRLTAGRRQEFSLEAYGQRLRNVLAVAGVSM